jgi:hypothetical protein
MTMSGSSAPRMRRDLAGARYRSLVVVWALFMALVMPVSARGDSGTDALELSIAPAVSSITPLGAIAFLATGGSGTGYVWSLATNASGGTIAPLSGAYAAGPIGNVTDVVLVTDSKGATATVTISVGPAMAITPSDPGVAPFGSLSFTATGGTGVGVLWQLVGNASGASIDATTGGYRAGGTPNVVDRVAVRDSAGNTAIAVVSVGSVLSVTPIAAGSPPLGSVTFAALGGAGSYVWSLVRSPSGGTIDAASGAYRAGAVPDVVDRVRVTDAVGIVVEADVTVGGGVELTPRSANVGPRSVIRFGALGGSGSGYTWSIDPNGTGATISQMGVYVAGSPGGATDRIVVRDALGNSTSASVNVGDSRGGDVELLPVGGATGLDSIEGGGGCTSVLPGRSGHDGAIHAAFGIALALAVTIRRRQRASASRRGSRANDPHRIALSG